MAWSQAQFDEGPRVGHCLRLPAMVGLIAAQGIFRSLSPFAGGFASEIVLADQRFLNGLRAIGVNLLLSAHPRRFLPS